MFLEMKRFFVQKCFLFFPLFALLCHNYELQYWRKQTEIAIIENALERYFGSLTDENQICPFPKSVKIGDETIK